MVTISFDEKELEILKRALSTYETDTGIEDTETWETSANANMARKLTKKLINAEKCNA